MTSHLTLKLDRDAKPIRIDLLMSKNVDRITRAECQRLIRSGAVSLNGTVVTLSSTLVRPGDRVKAAIPEDEAINSVPVQQDIAIDVVHEDDHILIVNKQAGIAVHAGAGRPDGTLVNALLARYPDMAALEPIERPGIVHRLDADTSGLMVVARTASAVSRLISDIKARRVERRYQALVLGKIKPAAGLIDRPIGRHPTHRTRQSVVECGKSARTRFAALAHFTVAHQYVSLVELKLETGRTHQIRVHMQAIGFPIVGDPTYGVSLPGVPLNRQFLHAYRLTFAHPTTGEHLSFQSDLPDDLENAMFHIGWTHRVAYGR